MKNTMHMLQAPEGNRLQEFFEWLLDPRHFPSLVPNQRKKFLPRIRREINHLQKLQQEAGLTLRDAIVCLEAHEKMIAEWRQYVSHYKARTSVAIGNIEQTERLFLATRVAKVLQPAESPHSVVRSYLAKQQFSGDRTIEARVRRFEKHLPPGECGRIAEAKYGDFKYSTLFPKIQQESRPREWQKNCWQIARQLGVTALESVVLEKLCQHSTTRQKS